MPAERSCQSSGNLEEGTDNSDLKAVQQEIGHVGKEPTPDHFEEQFYTQQL